MPINRADIPAIIKRAETRKLERWKQDYYEKVCRELQVHTKGHLFEKVTSLFPNEHPDSRDHCVASYEPITKASIWKGINNLKRIFLHSSFSFNVGEELSEWLRTYTYKGQTLMHYFVEQWVTRGVAEDPNGVFVVYPPEWAEARGWCPIQFVRTELIRSTEEGFAFTSEEESQIEYYYDVVATKREVFADPELDGRLNARTHTRVTYNHRLRLKVKKAVVHVFTLNGLLVYTREGGNNYDFEVTDFAEALSSLPVFPAGGPVADKADVELYESLVGPFLPFGNLALLQHRNHRAVDLSFSYPRMSELQMPCDYRGCVAGKVTVAGQGLVDCPRCKATPGWVTVQSPYKIYQPRYDPNDENKNEHLKVDPVKFYSPDAGIVSYSKDAWRDYLRLAEEGIFVQQRVYTGQVESAESKDKNLEDMHTWVEGGARIFYQNVRAALQALEDYLSASPVRVSVDKPYSLAILTEAEAFLALSNILASDAPVMIKGNRVDDFIGRFVSKDSPVVRALNILKKFDPLLYYSTAEIQTFNGASVVPKEMWSRHVLAYPLLVSYHAEDGTYFETTEDQTVIDRLNADITAAVPAPSEDIRRTLLDQFQGGPEA